MSQTVHNGFLRDDATGALVVSNSPNIQTVRVNVGAMAASSTTDVAITWPVPFADTNYTIVATLVDIAGTANADALRQVSTAPTATGCTIRVASGTVGYTSGQLFVHAVAIHD